jgi:hypothetical protein
LPISPEEVEVIASVVAAAQEIILPGILIAGPPGPPPLLTNE